MNYCSEQLTIRERGLRADAAASRTARRVEAEKVQTELISRYTELTCQDSDRKHPERSL